MKIWFDLTNSPHVHFFREMIDELKGEGHEIIVTSRDQANTVGLLELYGIEYHLVGAFYGKKLYNKIIGNIKRVIDLAKFIRKEKVDVGISQSSFASAVAGYFGHVPTIYTNDNEHALGNKVSFLFAKHIFVPEFIPVKKVTNFFVRASKVEQYPGVKEGIYLWHQYLNGSKVSSKRDKIFYRPEPYYAQYYKGKENMLDEAIIELKSQYDIVVLPRTKVQAEHYKNEMFSGITVCDQPLTFDEIAKHCLLFIGAGGTMNREMAVIGIPTISVYQDELLEVDRFLVKQGLMIHNPQLTSTQIVEAIEHYSAREPDESLLQRGKEAYNMIKNKLLSLK